MGLRKIQRGAIFALAAVLMMAMIGSSWAYWTQEKQVLNEYQTGKYSTEIVETFEPPKDWLPGQTVNKDVQIENEGTVPVFVKVKINQKWVRTKDIYDHEGNVILPAKGDSIPLVFTGTDKDDKYAALITFGNDVVLLKSGITPIPSLRLGLPVVNNAQDAKGKWLLLSETPDYAGDYTFYYIGVLEAGKKTPLLVDEVRMNPDIEASEKYEKFTFEKTLSAKTNSYGIQLLSAGGSMNPGDGWKQNHEVTENQTYSYENARYTLGVTMYTVQATKPALQEMFQSNQTVEQGVINYMQMFATEGKYVDYSRDDTVKTKRLWFDEQNGKMTYTPITNGDEWFMSHLNMLPGESYEDTLQIQNKSKKTFHLYMQVIPVDQQKLPDELLEYIHMKVYHGTELLYDGTARGIDYTGSIRNLQNVVSLGKYKSGAEKDIRVELTLDKDTPLEYSDIYSRIDWRFMVEEAKPDDPTNPENPKGPKTGDESHLILYTCVMTVCGALLILCTAWLIGDTKRRKKES